MNGYAVSEVEVKSGRRAAQNAFLNAALDASEMRAVVIITGPLLSRFRRLQNVAQRELLYWSAALLG
jgi:hypothetical protein